MPDHEPAQPVINPAPFEQSNVGQDLGFIQPAPQAVESAPSPLSPLDPEDRHSVRAALRQQKQIAQYFSRAARKPGSSQG